VRPSQPAARTRPSSISDAASRTGGTSKRPEQHRARTCTLLAAPLTLARARGGQIFSNPPEAAWGLPHNCPDRAGPGAGLPAEKRAVLGRGFDASVKRLVVEGHSRLGCLQPLGGSGHLTFCGGQHPEREVSLRCIDEHRWKIQVRREHCVRLSARPRVTLV